MSKERLITDFRCALPRDAWTDAEASVHTGQPAAMPRGKWRIIDYRSTRFSGSCLQTTCPDAAVLRIPLEQDGWHAVSIGLSHPWWTNAFVEVRLTGEGAWHILEGYRSGHQEGPPLKDHTSGSVLHEEPWCFADLTGRDLEVRYPADYPHAAAGGVCTLYSVRLTPVRPEDIAVLQTSRRGRTVQFLQRIDRPNNPRYDNDQWDIICSNNNILNMPMDLEALRWNWPQEPWEADAERLAEWRTMKQRLETGHDVVREAIEAAHRRGRRFWYAVRPQGWTSSAKNDQTFHSRFFAEHPGYRCVEADEAPLSKLSVAYPEVRGYLNNHLRQWVERGADGITVLLVRGYPLVRYEPPVVERFAQQYGEDARVVCDDDPRLLKLWADLVTEWIREVRRLLDEAGPTPVAQRRELGVVAGPSMQWNRQFGFDVAGWARQGLVDVVLPYPAGTFHTARLHGRYYDQPNGWVDMPGYRHALASTPVDLIPSLGHFADHFLPLAAIRRRAHFAYTHGAAGVCRWDNNRDLALARAHLDAPAQQALWAERYMPDQENWIFQLQGVRVDRFPPGIAY